MKRIAWPLAVALVLACVLLWLVVLRPEPATPVQPVADAPAAEPTAPAPTRPSPALDSHETRRERDRLAHAERIAKIRAAHSARARDDRVGPCTGPGCARVGEEIRDILDGCREHAPGTKGRIVLTADVLATQDVGTLVESVTLDGEGASDALRECLVESMYTIDLGVPEQAFAERVQVFLGGGIRLQLDAKSDPALRDATRQLAEYDDAADAAVRDGAYVISQGPIPADADDVGGE